MLSVTYTFNKDEIISDQQNSCSLIYFGSQFERQILCCLLMTKVIKREKVDKLPFNSIAISAFISPLAPIYGPLAPTDIKQL